MNPNLKNARIIVVDDEPINLTIMEISLGEQGCKVTTFQSAEECLRSIEDYNLKNYDCLITDYSMLGMSGIQLLEQIKQKDPTLEVILVTGENERLIIKESLRHGAFDFLDKPLNLEKFYHSIGRAVSSTSHRRKRDATEASLIAARSTGLLSQIDTTSWKSKVELVYTPKHELGGDFIEVFETKSGQKFAVFGDISGHDIQSALLSSHFLGNLEGQRSVSETLDCKQLFENYNQLLINRKENLSKQNSFKIGSSLSVCGIQLINDEKEISISNCGLPAIYMITNDGDVEKSMPQNHPLGWFEELNAEGDVYDLSNYCQLYGLTDGLIDFARNHNWDILSLIFHLQTLNKSDTQGFLINADDDILLANMSFQVEPPDQYPIIYGEYPGDTFLKIDQYQNTWKTSIELVIPDIDPKTMDRFVLACREGVLNALTHGCQRQRKNKATFCVKWDPSHRTLEGIIADPGTGHKFDYVERDQKLDALIPGNLGLVLISKLVDEFKMENNGSTIRMLMNV